MFPDDMTLKDAREALRKLAEDGAICPLCVQNVKVYRRTIHASMAAQLITIYKAVGTSYGYLPDILGDAGGDVAKLRYWGLLERWDARREDGSNRAGVWRVTAKGVQFLSGGISVPKTARVYADRLLSMEGRSVTIRDCLGSKFDYSELMAGVREPALF